MNFNPDEVVVCIPAYSKAEWEEWTRAFVMELLDDGFHDYNVQIGPNQELNRNMCVALDMSFPAKLNPHVKKYVHLDCDNRPLKSDVYKLLSYDYPIVGGTYRKNGDDGYYTAIGMNGNNIRRNPELKGIHEVMANGWGTMVVDHSVYRKLDIPWYVSGFVNVGDRLRYQTVDYYFCYMARKAGYKIMVDFDMEIGHVVRQTEDFNKSFQL